MSDSDEDEGMDAGAVADAEAAARMEGATVERIETGRAAGARRRFLAACQGASMV